MDDFDVLVAKSRDLGLHVIIDLVPNHSSKKHPWFEASRSKQRYEDFYVWHDGAVDDKGNALPPNNWVCVILC